MELKSISEISAETPIIIAGPCSAETEEQVMHTARQIASKGIKIFRAGLWKPRTRPGGFEGVGSKGLAWLSRVKEETGLRVIVEVATSRHVEDALKHNIDMCWIGARTSSNPFAVQEIANALRGVDISVLIKNPVNSDLSLWIGAIERIHNAGIHSIAAIHRGFSSYYERKYRNTPLWHIPIELRNRIPGLPLFCDPSHITGKRELLYPIAQQAMDLGFNGLMLETHCCPEKAWTDCMQQLTPDGLEVLLKNLSVNKITSDELKALEAKCRLHSLTEFAAGVNQLLKEETARNK